MRESTFWCGGDAVCLHEISSLQTAAVHALVGLCLSRQALHSSFAIHLMHRMISAPQGEVAAIFRVSAILREYPMPAAQYAVMFISTTPGTPNTAQNVRSMH